MVLTSQPACEPGTEQAIRENPRAGSQKPYVSFLAMGVWASDFPLGLLRRVLERRSWKREEIERLWFVSSSSHPQSPHHGACLFFEDLRQGLAWGWVGQGMSGMGGGCW